MSDKADWKIEQAAVEAVSRATTLMMQRAQKDLEAQHQHQPREVSEDKKRRNAPAPGRIVLVSHEERMTLRARLDDGYPLFFGGYGGWEDEQRPGQVAATIFRGASAPQLKVRMILGNWPVKPVWATPCERAMNMLDHFARMPIDSPRQERPTLLRIRGHLPHHNRRWFIQDVEWGDVDLFKGKRARAFVTVTLRMYVPLELLKRRDPAARPTTVYKVKRGEDLNEIVHKKLDVKGAREVAAARAFVRRLNRLKKGERVRPDQRIKLPVGGWWRRAAKAGRLDLGTPFGTPFATAFSPPRPSTSRSARR